MLNAAANPYSVEYYPVEFLQTVDLLLNLVLWLYDIMSYTTSSFGATEPSAPDQGFEIDPDVV